ncbi:MAG: hypothetical protein QHG99_02915 [Methanomicrobiales archaeon]|nr:hypothetical protein [Methanomicrobiales archaeon]
MRDECVIRAGIGSDQPDEMAGAGKGPFSERIFEVGHSRFTVESDDSELLKELRIHARELEGVSVAESRFIWRLVKYTEAGTIRPWRWQQQLGRG